MKKCVKALLLVHLTSEKQHDTAAKQQLAFTTFRVTVSYRQCVYLLLMPSNAPHHQSSLERIAQSGAYEQIRRQRLMQICVAIAVGLASSLLVARDITFYIFVVSLLSTLLAFTLALRHRIQMAISILIGSMALMLFAFALTGAGLFDLAILGFPGLLIIAAVLGGLGVFISVLIIALLQCVAIVWLVQTGAIVPHTPSASWAHLVFICVILTITGFSVFILVNDIKRLLSSLQYENEKVLESQVKIQHLAHHDPLTNLPNRAFGEQLFQQKLEHYQATKRGLALLFLDLDNFKPVNDALGHAAGDQLLEQLAQRLSDVLTEEHVLIRFGGDEFIVLAPYPDNSDYIETLANSLIQQCCSVFEVLHTQVVVSASIGIACTSDLKGEFKQLCRKADIAMYQAKQNGRNTFHFYDEALDRASSNRFNLLQLLRPAVQQSTLVLYYQPMVELSNGRITAVEALLRWPQADGSMTPPDEFIPVAESSGLINQLGQWVIEQACLFCAQQRASNAKSLRVAVNLSVVQFKDGRLQAIVESALAQAGLPAHALELELTESVLIDDTDQIFEQLRKLRMLGVTIAIDDFGTGYSNLGYLRDFNASKLKIDRTFVSAMMHSEQDESLVKAIISMAQSMGLETVAEGIENKPTEQKLAALGCTFGQGYYWSKPLSEAEIIHKLSETSGI